MSVTHTKYPKGSQNVNNISQIKVQNPPKLFSKVGVCFLIFWMVGLFVIVQMWGIYLFTPVVLNSPQMITAERLAIGSYNGTVISYTMILAFCILSLAICTLIKWKLYRLERKTKKASKDSQFTKYGSKLNSANVNVNQTRKYSTFGYLEIESFAPKISIAFFSLWVVFALASESITYLLGKNPSAFVDVLYFSAQPKWLLILVMVVIVPIYEELVFRGILWSALKEQIPGEGGVILASVVTSLIFAFIHLQYDLYEMSVIFILALIFSYARHKSGSLLLPMLIHIINNSLAMWQYLYSLS